MLFKAVMTGPHSVGWPPCHLIAGGTAAKSRRRAAKFTSLQSFDALLRFCNAAAKCARIELPSFCRIAAHPIGLPERQHVRVIGLGKVELGPGAARLDGAFEPKSSAVDIALEDQRLCPREQFALACRRGVLFTTRRIAGSCG